MSPTRTGLTQQGRLLESTSERERAVYILYLAAPNDQSGSSLAQVQQSPITEVFSDRCQDIDAKSLDYARQNVKANNLQDRIKLLLTKPESFLSSIPFDDMQYVPYNPIVFFLMIRSIDFTMCNPPFYSSNEDMISSANSKQRPPFTACTGSANEMVTPGGEVAFVSRMIDESLVIKHGCQWYTSMLGKFSSIAPIVEMLRRHGVSNWAVTEFVQGTRTRRWAVAWSFGGLRPSMKIGRGVGSLQKGLLPFPSEYTITVSYYYPLEVQCLTWP